MPQLQDTDPFHFLSDKYGLIMKAKEVQLVLRYRSAGGFRAARSLGTLQLDMFAIPGRRGLFARTADVARLMAQLAGTSDGGHAM